MNAITDLFSWGIYICTRTTVSICISVKLPIPVDTLTTRWLYVGLVLGAGPSGQTECGPWQTTQTAGETGP